MPSTTPPRLGRATLVGEGVLTFLRILRANLLSLVGFALVVVMVVVALVVHFDPSILRYGVEQQTIDLHQAPSWNHLFGTDELGHDMYTETVSALPLDLGIGLAIAGISLLIGGVLGLVAGFWDRPGSWTAVTSGAIMRVTDVFLSFPSLILALAITTTLGRGVGQVILAVVATWWPYYVRLVRGEVLAVKHQGYITAARSAGVSDVRILFRHVVRNVLDPIIVYLTLDIGTILVTFSTIAFVAAPLAYPGPTPEWGSMIFFYQDYLQQYPWTVLAPGLAVFVSVFAFSLLGDGLRDVLDPRSRRAFVKSPTLAPPMPAGPLEPPPRLPTAGSGPEG